MQVLDGLGDLQQDLKERWGQVRLMSYEHPYLCHPLAYILSHPHLYLHTCTMAQRSTATEVLSSRLWKTPFFMAWRREALSQYSITYGR